jgi:hypothetical protein
MWKVEDQFRVIIGGNTYINTPNVIVYKGTPLFILKRSENDGILGIDFDIYDKKEEKVATVRNGVIVQGDKRKYDISSGMDRYIVTDIASGRVICDIRKRSQAPNAELEVSVKMYTRDGFLIDAGPDQTNIGGLQLRGNTFENCGAGIAIN